MPDASPAIAAEPSPATIAVVDIDGVVADVRHRLHHVRGPHSRWDRFFAAAAEDPPLATGIALVADLARAHDVVWLSGRPEGLREVTAAWLERQDLPPGRLYLRRARDYRPARVMKLERIRDLARHAAVAAVIDDDPDVVDTLHAAGFPAVLADWVPHDKTLHRAQERDGRT
ncbi:MAG: hypothetical protein M3140_01720 [Actinomycetota bacterium]|nr:hypothetical protein [Actinomycetota bacterium]